MLLVSRFSLRIFCSHLAQTSVGLFQTGWTHWCFAQFTFVLFRSGPNEMRISLTLLWVVASRHFDNDDSLINLDADSSEEGNRADPWRFGAQRVDGNDCGNVNKLGEQYYNCPSYFSASDLTTSSCRKPCVNAQKNPEICITSNLV
eukprot:symbB.v1.2.000927.t1/scaffold27.1/size414596/35